MTGLALLNFGWIFVVSISFGVLLFIIGIKVIIALDIYIKKNRNIN
jgi:hypothetical protein